ncbi:hypothetical protein M514_26110 [Trichuris suis]|uniref:HTH CENPB-type domain-containing protein n=1 Tax=Trichuris suis TaxID=68888 RepID=A0A085MWW3_9BILA|nr:hypothetical protein M514_26110 [Trichuris suis]
MHGLDKQKDRPLEFNGESDEQKLMRSRKTLHISTNHDLGRVLKEWIHRHRSGHVPLSCETIRRQARHYHNELKIGGSCEYSTGCFQKFKEKNGIKVLRIFDDKASALHKAAEEFIEEFSKITADGKLTPDQIFNADEPSLF